MDLYDDIELFFQDADKKEFKGIDSAEGHTLEKSSGRLEERRYELIDICDLHIIKMRAAC